MISPALLLFSPSVLNAQIACDNDNVEVEFTRLKGGVLTLNDVKTREITGANNADASIAVRNPGSLSSNYGGGVIYVDGLDAGNFPGSNILQSTIDRRANHIWEADFPKGLYEFRNKRDLRIEVFITVTDGQASHITAGHASAVTLDVDEEKVHEIWWNGSDSLRKVWGGLTFSYSDLRQLTMAGIHRANIDVCVNIRGYL